VKIFQGITNMTAPWADWSVQAEAATVLNKSCRHSSGWRGDVPTEPEPTGLSGKNLQKTTGPCIDRLEAVFRNRWFSNLRCEVSGR